MNIGMLTAADREAHLRTRALAGRGPALRRWILCLLLPAFSGCHRQEPQPVAKPAPPGLSVKGYPLLACPCTPDDAQNAQQATAATLQVPTQVRLDLGAGVTLGLVLVPAGHFVFQGKQKRQVNYPYYIGETEVTNEQFDASGVPRHVRRTRDTPKLPMMFGSYEQAVTFLAALSKRLNCTMRLPAEIEWEFAARCGTTGKYGVPGTDPTTLGNIGGWDAGDDKYVPAGKIRLNAVEPASYPPNAWGLFDALGNVGELCIVPPAEMEPGGDRLFIYTKGGNVGMSWGYFDREVVTKGSFPSFVGVRAVLEIDDGLLARLKGKEEGYILTGGQR